MKWWLDQIKEKVGTSLFVNPDYGDVDYFLDHVTKLGPYIWPSVRTDLNAVMGSSRINEVIKLDGVGSGKTFYVVMLLKYALYLLGHLRDPSRAFGLAPGSKVAIVIASLREAQAKGLVMDDLKNRLDDCAWFKANYRYQEESSRIIKFPNRVFVLSGSSSETVPIGYNVLLGVTDEGDWFLNKSHIGDSLDQMENIYFSLHDRIETRFEQMGLLVLISSARNPDGFMVTRKIELETAPHAYTTQRAIWQSKPGKWSPYFIVDIQSLKVIDKDVDEPIYEKGKLVSIPMRYYNQFMKRPRRFLRDRASVITVGSSSYVTRPDSVEENVNYGRVNPVESGVISSWFQPLPNVVYFSHNDLGLSVDTCSLCVGHQDGMKTIIDMVYVIDPKEEGKINFERVRQVFYELHQRGFLFGLITWDHFQTEDIMQRLTNFGLPVDYLSVDKDTAAYDSWLEANYAGEFDIPPVVDKEDPYRDYMFNVHSLIMKGRKIDHRSSGAKDITDSVAGTTYLCRSNAGYQVRGKAK